MIANVFTVISMIFSEISDAIESIYAYLGHLLFNEIPVTVQNKHQWPFLPTWTTFDPKMDN